MLTDSKEIFIDLVSNASMDIFPENTLSKFKNRLSQPLRLSGNWVVGVQEIFYPITFTPTKKTVNFCLSYAAYDQSTRLAGTFGMVEYSDDEPADLIFDKINKDFERLLDADGIVLKDDKAREAPKLKIAKTEL